MTITPERKSITATMFQHMHEHRLFDPDERIELINGELIAPGIPYRAILLHARGATLAAQSAAFTLVVADLFS